MTKETKILIILARLDGLVEEIGKLRTELVELSNPENAYFVHRNYSYTSDVCGHTHSSLYGAVQCQRKNDKKKSRGVKLLRSTSIARNDRRELGPNEVVLARQYRYELDARQYQNGEMYVCRHSNGDWRGYFSLVEAGTFLENTSPGWKLEINDERL